MTFQTETVFDFTGREDFEIEILQKMTHRSTIVMAMMETIDVFIFNQDNMSAGQISLLSVNVISLQTDFGWIWVPWVDIQI